MKSMQLLPRFAAERAFYALAGGQFASTVGPGMTRFGLGLCALDQAEDIAAQTIVLFAAVLRLEVASLLAGPLVGHWNNWWTMIITNAGASGTTRVAAPLYFPDALAVGTCTSLRRERHYLPVHSAGTGRAIRRLRSARLGIFAISHT